MMKSLMHVAALSLAMIAPTAGVHAADAASKAGASIIAALEIKNTADMNFGSIVPDTASSGTVVMGSKGGITCAANLTCLGDGLSSAVFTVSGEPNYTYALTLPTTVTLSNGSETMTLNDLSSTLGGGTGTLSSGGSSSFGVGGTLTVGAKQAQGDYTGSIAVTVEYN